MLHVAVNAHLLNRSSGYRQAGVSRYIDQMLKHLWSERIRLTIYTAPGLTRDALGSPPDHVRIVSSRLPTQDPMARIVWEQCLAPSLLRRDRPDVLWCPLNAIPLCTSCPTVLTIHDLAFFRHRLHRNARGAYLRAITRLSARRAAHVVTVSEFTRREVVDVLGVPPGQVTAIPNGRDPRFTPGDPDAVKRFRAEKNLPDRFLLFVGTLEPRKNLSTLLRAYAQVRSRLGCPLILGGGEGWKYHELFQLVEELHLRPHVRFAGFIDPEDLPLYYAAATAFVYPSLYEGFGLPPLEALATGTPTIVSDAAALSEVVGDAALTVPSLDVSALAEALVRIISDHALREILRNRGFKRAERFSWISAARTLLNVLRTASGHHEPEATKQREAMLVRQPGR